MSDTGILLRRGTKNKFLDNPPVEGEFTFAYDTYEHGFINSNGDIIWEVLAERSFGFEPPSGMAPNGSKYTQLPKESETIIDNVTVTLENSNDIDIYHNGAFTNSYGVPVYGLASGELPFDYAFINQDLNSPAYIGFYSVDERLVGKSLNINGEIFLCDDTADMVYTLASDGLSGYVFEISDDFYQPIKDNMSFNILSEIIKHYNFNEWTFYDGKWNQDNKIVIGSEFPQDTSNDPDGTMYYII